MDCAAEAVTSGNAGCERKAAGQFGIAQRPSLQGPIGGAGEGRPLPLLLMKRYVCARVSQECLRQRAITLACDLSAQCGNQNARAAFSAPSCPRLSRASTSLAPDKTWMGRGER